VAAVVQYFDPSFWSGTVAAAAADLGRAAFWGAVLQIVLINILVSGDNAVVIALACRGLPQHQRRWGLVIGAAIAIVLRIVFAIVIAGLMRLPYVKLVGGAALLVIAAKLLVPDDADEDDIAAEAHLWRAVWIVVVADVVMSFDNVLAIVAAAHDQLILLAAGLVLSIPIIIAGSALVMAVFDRLPILIWAGAALLGWVAGDTIASDPVLATRLTTWFGAAAPHVQFAAAGASVLLVIGVGGLWRRLHLSKSRARSPRNRSEDR